MVGQVPHVLCVSRRRGSVRRPVCLSLRPPSLSGASRLWPVINDTTEGAQLARHPVGFLLWQGRPPLSALALGWWHTWEHARLLGRRGSCPLPSSAASAFPTPHRHAFPAPSPRGPLVLRSPHQSAFVRRICASTFASPCFSHALPMYPSLLRSSALPCLPVPRSHTATSPFTYRRALSSGVRGSDLRPTSPGDLGPRRSQSRWCCPSGGAY